MFKPKKNLAFTNDLEIIDFDITSDLDNNGKFVAKAIGAGNWSGVKTNVIKGESKGGNTIAAGYQAKGKVEIGGKKHDIEVSYRGTNFDEDDVPQNFQLNIKLPKGEDDKDLVVDKEVKELLNKKFTATSFRKFVEEMQGLKEEAIEVIKGCGDQEGSSKRKRYQTMRCLRGSLTGKMKLSLFLHNSGMFNVNDESRSFNPSMKWIQDNWTESPTTYKEQTPLAFKSPFARRDMSARRVRDKWRPTQQPTQPLAYRPSSPMRFEETNAPINEEPVKTVWDKIDEYGGEQAIKSTVENFVGNTTFNSEIDKPLKAFQSSNYTNVIQEFADSLAQEMKTAGINKDNKARQNVMSKAQTLIGDINIFAQKFNAWTNMKGGDKTPGNIGGDMTSKGSNKIFDFNQNTIMMGDPDVNMGITPEGNIHFKRNDIADLISVGDLDKGVMHRNYEGIQTFAKMQETYHSNAIEGLPLNESTTEGTVSGILQTKDALLSWAHDENSGKSWITEYAEANPNEDLSWAMPESEQFDYDRLYDEVHGWMSHKLNEAYTHVSQASAELPKKTAAKEILTALESEENVRPESPQDEKSPMTYAQQLIKKYS